MGLYEAKSYQAHLLLFKLFFCIIGFEYLLGFWESLSLFIKGSYAVWWKKQYNETLFCTAGVFHANCSPVLFFFLTKACKVLGTSVMFLATSLPYWFQQEGKSSSTSPLYMARNEIRNIPQERWKWRDKGQERRISFHIRYEKHMKNYWRRKRMEGWFRWFMGFSFEAHKTPRK